MKGCGGASAGCWTSLAIQCHSGLRTVARSPKVSVGWASAVPPGSAKLLFGAAGLTQCT